MAIQSMDQLTAALATAQILDTIEASTSCQTGQFKSLWLAGGHPSAGAVPGSAAGIAPTSSTAGAIPFSNTAGSNTSYLSNFMATGSSYVLPSTTTTGQILTELSIAQG